MKKLFISQPMRGLTDEEILKAREEIRARAEHAIGEPVELIDSFIKDYPGEINKHVPVFYLGKSIIYKDFNITVKYNDFFSNHFAILGNSGDGKTTSTIINPDGNFDMEHYQGMNPESHFILNLDRKTLPFPGGMWSKEKKNYLEIL